MLMSCVAGGIIGVSTAAGIGRPLQDGLYEREKKPDPDK